MSYNGSGTFQINTAGQPVVSGTTITSTAFNLLTADLATGLSTAITKDGQTTTTASIPFALGITLSGTASNITLGSNYISNGGTDAGLSLDAANNATFSANGTFGGTALALTAANSTNNSVVRAENTTNAGASHAYLEAKVGGAVSTGDPQVRLTIPSGTSWYMAVDNSSSDTFFIGTGTTVGLGPFVQVDTGGAFSALCLVGKAITAQTIDDDYAMLAVNNHGSSPFGLQINYSAAAPNGTTNLFVLCNDTGGTKHELRDNGGYANFSANNVNLSDARAKILKGASDDHTDFVKALADKYQKTSYEGSPDVEFDSVTAQDVEALAPELVTTFADVNGTMMKGIFSQRLQERINATVSRLVSRVEALEARP